MKKETQKFSTKHKFIIVKVFIRKTVRNENAEWVFGLLVYQNTRAQNEAFNSLCCWLQTFKMKKLESFKEKCGRKKKIYQNKKHNANRFPFFLPNKMQNLEVRKRI